VPESPAAVLDIIIVNICSYFRAIMGYPTRISGSLDSQVVFMQKRRRSLHPNASQDSIGYGEGNCLMDKVPISLECADICLCFQTVIFC
jgi:hypothetical protein